MAFKLRRATASEADAIADVYSASFRLLTFLPILHTIDEYRWFIANVILKECEVTVAEDENGIVAFLARKGEEVRLLYTRPDRIGMGAGTQLIDAAKASGIGTTFLRSTRLSPDPIYRWCGQRGADARHPLSVEIFGEDPLPAPGKTREPGLGGGIKCLREFRSGRQLHGCQREFSPPLIAIDGLPSSLRTSCLRRCADVGQADRH